MKTYTSTLDQFFLRKEKSNIKRAQIRSSKEAYDYIKEFYFDDIEIYESFFVLLLNRVHNTIGYAKISQGGTVGTVVDIKLIAKYCVSSLSASILVAHNHPSGNINPSDKDIEITKSLKQGLSLLDVNVIDHIILTSDKYYSFADEGLL